MAVLHGHPLMLILKAPAAVEALVLVALAAAGGLPALALLRHRGEAG